MTEDFQDYITFLNVMAWLVPILIVVGTTGLCWSLLGLFADENEGEEDEFDVRLPRR